MRRAPAAWRVRAFAISVRCVLRIPEEAVDFQRRNNRQSATCWQQFADHRAHVTRLAREAGGGRLAVLGAGNCNDLELPELSERFGQIHLIDIDDEAITRARSRQLPATAGSLVLRAPVDVSGAMPWLDELRTGRPTAAPIDALPELCVRNVVTAIGETFDAVVSACVLSQIMHTVGRVLGVDHPDLGRVRSALAVAHTRSLARLVRPGGTGVLVTDVCTSRLDPSLEGRFARCDRQSLLGDLERDGAILSGTGPSVHLEALTRPAAGGPLAGAARVVGPWLWHMGPLALLVYAIVFTRAELDQ
jgi:hypothetical protein